MVGRGAYGVVQKAKWKKRFIVAVKTIEDFSIAKEDVAGEVLYLSLRNKILKMKLSNNV